MEEHKKMLEQNEYVFIKYSANFCRPCKSPVLLQKYESLKEKYNEDVKFKEYISENDEEIFEYERINSVPTFRFYIDGEVKYEKVGLLGLEEISKLIKEIFDF